MQATLNALKAYYGLDKPIPDTILELVNKYSAVKFW